MKIEVLFPEICNLYGDLFNVKYLKECLPECQIVNTSLKDEPLFLTEKPDLIYMGTTTESGQQLIIDKLLPYKEKVVDCIDSGYNFLFTGNAMEVLFNEIIEEDKKICDGLGIFDLSAKRKARKRFNSLYVGCFNEENFNEPIKIVGFKSLFGFAYGKTDLYPLFITERGDGMNKECKEEGIRKNNFFGTYITGPLLVLNPVFTKWFMSEIMEVQNPVLAFEDAAMDAYNDRVKEYTDSNTGIYY